MIFMLLLATAVPTPLTPDPLSSTELAGLISAVTAAVIGVVSLVINRKGAAESRAQQTAANELERRSQGYEEMRAIAQERAADNERKDREIGAMQERIDRLREENRLLRELTRSQIAVAEAHNLIPPMEGELPDRAHLEDRPPLPPTEPMSSE